MTIPVHLGGWPMLPAYSAGKQGKNIAVNGEQTAHQEREEKEVRQTGPENWRHAIFDTNKQEFILTDPYASLRKICQP